MSQSPFDDLSGDDVLEAIKQGVEDAFWRMITNATGAPCGDFFAMVKEGVKEAMLELGEKQS